MSEYSTMLNMIKMLLDNFNTLFKKASFLKISTLIKMFLIKTHAKFRPDQYAFSEFRINHYTKKFLSNHDVDCLKWPSLPNICPTDQRYTVGQILSLYYHIILSKNLH